MLTSQITNIIIIICSFYLFYLSAKWLLNLQIDDKTVLWAMAYAALGVSFLIKFINNFVAFDLPKNIQLYEKFLLSISWWLQSYSIMKSKLYIKKIKNSKVSLIYWFILVFIIPLIFIISYDYLLIVNLMLIVLVLYNLHTITNTRNCLFRGFIFLGIARILYTTNGLIWGDSGLNEIQLGLMTAGLLTIMFGVRKIIDNRFLQTREVFYNARKN